MTPAGPPLFPYVGRTRSHAKFREKFKYANALYYLIVSGKDLLREHLETALRNGKREALEQGRPSGWPHLLCIVTNAISRTQFEAVLVHSTDGRAMVEDFDQFIATHIRQCIISAHRMMVDLELDLLEELLDKSLIDLPDELVGKVRSRFIKPIKLSRAWDDLGVPVAATDDVEASLKQLSELRNVIEHNDENATALYCKLYPEYGLSPGNKVPVGSREVGHSFSVINHVAEALDRRALEKWPDAAIT